MAKISSTYICQACGSIHNKWAGRCNDCGEWNSIIEEVIDKQSTNYENVPNLEFSDLNNTPTNLSRIDTTIEELNRVLGGGLVPGSVILVGGDPGIGKSTLLLQLVAYLSANENKSIYIAGEESIDQIILRAKRLGLEKNSVKLIAATNCEAIIGNLLKEKSVNLVIIDSIQTMYSTTISSAPGTVSQVKATSYEFIKYAKENNVAIILVGHVTKEGQLAGPKVLEHMVDTVIYFEGERNNDFRIIRSVKNRFGGVNEIGVFEMHDTGLRQIPNPSALFLSPQNREISGSTIFAGIEGTRPVLVEIQSLIAPSYLPSPRRSVIGWDLNRLSMLIAVLNSRYGLNILNKEVYLNVVGGFKINEPAADLAVLCSLISSTLNKAIKTNTIIFGEVGLSGEVRKISKADVRLKEAIKLGFTKAIVPYGTDYKDNNLELIEIAHIKQLQKLFI